MTACSAVALVPVRSRQRSTTPEIRRYCYFHVARDSTVRWLSAVDWLMSFWSHARTCHLAAGARSPHNMLEVTCCLHIGGPHGAVGARSRCPLSSAQRDAIRFKAASHLPWNRCAVWTWKRLWHSVCRRVLLMIAVKVLRWYLSRVTCSSRLFANWNTCFMCSLMDRL